MYGAQLSNTVGYFLKSFSAEFNGILWLYTIWEYVYGKCVCLSEKKSSAQPSKDLILPMLPLQYYKLAELFPIYLHASKIKIAIPGI